MIDSIWKYPLKITDIQKVKMPLLANLLSVANQNGILCLWAIGDPRQELQERTIEIIGTGNPVSVDRDENDRAFIGTVVIDPFVWHVFERI